MSGPDCWVLIYTLQAFIGTGVSSMIYDMRTIRILAKTVSEHLIGVGLANGMDTFVR